MVIVKLESILYLLVLILGVTVAIAPWTFAPVCMAEMRCWTTRNVETILGAVISAISLFALYKSAS